MPATDAPLPSAEPQTLQQQLIAHLNIPLALTSRPKHVEIHVAYSKYLGVHSAQANMNRMISDGIWPFKLLSTDTLVEIFVSKSVWYTFLPAPVLTLHFIPDLIQLFSPLCIEVPCLYPQYEVVQDNTTPDPHYHP